MQWSERTAHEAVDITVEVRVERFRCAVADVFIGTELAAPSAIGQLYGSVCPIPLPICVQRNFAEARLIAGGVLAQFVAQPGKSLYEALDGRCAGRVLWPIVIGSFHVTPPTVSFAGGVGDAVVIAVRFTGDPVALRR